MEIRKFEHTSDVEIMKEWLRERNMDEALLGELPHLGLIAFDDEEVVCAGFLRMVEGSYALMDSLTTNPRSSSSKRNVALDLMTCELKAVAESLGLKQVIAYCEHEATIERGLAKHGFVKLGHTVLTTKLKERG